MMTLPLCHKKSAREVKVSAKKYPRKNLDLVSDLIINKYKCLYITNSDRKLYDIILRKNISQQEFDNFIQDWDIEAEGGMKALLLSYFMKAHPELKYPEYIEPRLKGIIQFYRFKNLEHISHFIKICNSLKENNIDIMIIKGGAIKHYRQSFPRIMGDIDILLRNKEDYDKCKKIVESLGYSYMELEHSMDLHEGNDPRGILDIHHKILMLSGNEEILNEDLFERAHLDKVFQVENIYVPSCEDIVFITLVNLTKNLMYETSCGSRLHSAVDCAFFMEYKQDFDWNIVFQNAKKTNTEPQIYMAIKYINEFLQIKLPKIFDYAWTNQNIIFTYRLFLEILKKKSHKLTIINAFKNRDNLLYYLKFRSQYFLYKRKTIRKNAKLAKYVLETQRLIV